MNLRALLLEAPDTQLDKNMQPLILKWNNPPSAIQILEVLDHCVHSALASSVVIILLQEQLRNQLVTENISREELNKQAHWRNER